jgi:glycosyltransferase involved in cell wall biosynthesis
VRDSVGLAGGARVSALGRSLFADGTKLHVRGVTYGTFAEGGYPSPEVVASDFAAMAAIGVNAVRTYTVPPALLLDLAHEHGLRVLIGLPWEQHVTFLAERARRRSISERVRTGVRACAGHPAVLAYAVGNEIPSSIVRWHGRRPVERFLRELVEVAKDEDPDGLVTYVNYPSTEYLDLEFADLACFNVFLETRDSYEAYLARLQNIAGDRPLLITELGLDSRRNGLEGQAEALQWQLASTYACGAAGAFVFAWTDEWHRGGYEIDDWDFGLVDRAREPKRALDVVRRSFEGVPFEAERSWPSVSIVVCAYNAEPTLPECLEAANAVDYPEFEVIVVDDGSTDATGRIAVESGARVLATENDGLGSARNLGLEAARGEIVAYLDSDAYPDRDWLKHLAATLLAGDHAGVGGPNIPPPDDGWVADCVAKSPGGPIHVLLSDRVAEHIPGCNMAFWKSSLEAVGGFDPRFRIAGDDVDVCWKLQERGWTLGFSPGAVVWHHRRASVWGYLRQQLEYGRCEALLERKWPERYNSGGHLTWTGRVYGNGHNFRRWRIYYGTWGSELFQSRRERPAGVLASIPSLPEWMLIVAGLAALSALGVLWNWLFLGLALVCLAMLAPLANAIAHASRRAAPARLGRREWIKRWVLTTGLHLGQPLARLSGRMRQGLVPWRRHGVRRFALPLPRTRVVWSEEWRSPEEWLRRVESRARSRAPVSRGGAYDRWDLQIHGGVLGSTRTRMALEEHGSGKQLLRFRTWPKFGLFGLAVALMLALLGCAAALDGALPASAVLGAAAAGMLALVARHTGATTAAMGDVLAGLRDAEAEAAAAATARHERISREAMRTAPVTVSELVEMRPSESQSWAS